MFHVSSLLAVEDGWQLLAIAGVVGTVAIAAAASTLTRMRSARGAARLGWLAGAIAILLCGAAAVYFITTGVHNAPPPALRRALLVAGLTLVVLGTGIVAAFVDRHLATKNVLLDVALNNMAHGLMMFDQDGGLMLFNQRYVDLYRLPKGALKRGMSLREIIDLRIANDAFDLDPDDYCRNVLAAIARGESSKQIIGMEDGRTIAVIGEPLAGGGWVATHQDVTEEHKREASFRFLFNDNPLPMWVWDHETFGFLAVNNAALEKYGYEREQFLALTLRDIKRTTDRGALEGVTKGDEAKLRAGIISTHAKSDGSLVDVELYGRSMIYEGRPASLVAVIDTTDRKRAENDVREAREFLKTVIESVPLPIIVKNVDDGAYVLINEAAEEQFGVAREKAIGRTAYELLSKEEADVTVARDEEMLAANGNLFVEAKPTITSRGSRFLSSLRVPIRDASGKPRYILGVMEDVTERKRKDDELRSTRTFLDTIIENMPAMLLVKDARDFRYVLVNRAAEQVYGIRSEDMIGKTAAQVFPNQSRGFIEARDRALLDRGDMIVVDEQPFETPRNGTRLLASKKLLVRDEEGQPQYVLSMSEDVTERIHARDRIAHMSRHDPLTDLPNRAAFNDKLAATLNASRTSNQMFAVVSIDIDRFKEINDVLGHAAGDAVLCEIARRLREAADGQFLARLGGDEFGLIIESRAQPSGAEKTAESLLRAMSADIDGNGQTVHAGLSIGVAVFPTDGRDATTIVANANAALYRAKAAGRGTVRFFEAHMDERLREGRALQHELNAAVEHEELTLHYQPQAKIGGDVIGFEALVRWHHPVRGMVPPSSFIPLAEESGLIGPMGEWILRAACREAASWPKPLQIAVNLSPVQFRDGDLPSLVHAILLETGLAPHRLELEVTEGVLINDFARAVSILRRLKLLGVGIAMDDFGTGYSSLSYLQSFPFDKIKIDRTFIANLTDNHYSATIVRAVIGLGRGLGLPVMAEGVETAEQLAFLAKESCDEVQGYLIGRPSPIDTYAAMIGRRGPQKLKLVRA